MSAGGGQQVLGRAVHYIDLDDSRFNAGVQRAEAVARGGFGRINSILRGALAVGIGVSAFNSSIFAIRQAFEFASEGVIFFNARLDQTTAAFEKLLGSRLEAEQQFARLFEFAKRTPFEFDAVLKGATVLQVFGANANDAEGAVAGVGRSVLLSSENLQLFGDAAAATVDVTGSLSNGFKQSTFWIGRMYQALQNDKPIGRAALSLERLGLLLPEVREQIELAASAGATGDEQFAIFKTSLERFRGLQRIQQQSFFTQISTVNDNVTRILAKTGRPVFDNIVSFLTRVNEELESPAAGRFVDDITAGVQRLAVRARSFLSDPTIQRQALDFLRAAGDSLRNIVQLAGTLATVATPYLKVIQLIIQGVNKISEGFGTNAITLATLVGLALRFNRQIRIGGDILTGRSNALQLPRDARGNVLTAREESVARNREEQRLRKELAAQEERQRRAAAQVARTEASLAAARDQVRKNVQGREDRAAAARERAAERAVAAQVREQTARNQLLAAVDREQIAKNKLNLENQRLATSIARLNAQQTVARNLDLEIADIQQRQTENAARKAAARGGTDPIGRVMSFEQRAQLEAEAKKAVEAQQRAVARARVLAFAPTGTDADRRRLTAESKALTDLRRNIGEIGQANLAIQQREVILASDLKNAEAERLAILKQIEATEAQIAQRKATQQAADLRAVGIQRQIATQQATVARLASTVALPATAGTRVLRTGGGATLQETTRLANTTGLLAQRQRALATEIDKTNQKKAELARVTGTAGGAYDRFMGVLGRATAVMFALTLAYGALNAIAGVMFHDSIPNLIQSWRKYGDTLAVARRQAQEFFDVHKDQPDAEKLFRQEIEKTNEAVAKATAERDRLQEEQTRRQAEQPHNLNIFDPRRIQQAIGVIGDIQADRRLDEAKAKLEELIRLQRVYNAEWFNLDESARLYQAYLNGTAKLTADVVRDLMELERSDPRFAEMMERFREEAQGAFSTLGVEGEVTPAIIARIKRDAERFRDVGQQSLLAYIDGFTKNQGEVFDAATDLADRVFKAMGKEGAVADIEMGNLELAIARATDEMSTLGSVSAVTAAEIRDLAGAEGGDRILAMVEKLSQYHQSLELVARATENLKAAEEEAERVRRAHTRILDEESAKLQVLEDDIERLNQAREDEIALLRERADALREEAAEAARYHADIIDGLNERQEAVQREADAVDRGHQKRIDAIQDELDVLNESLEAAQRAEKDHADAAQAAIEGRVEAYRRERGEVDALTEQLLARYEQEIGAARRLKDATEERASDAARAQRRQLLAFDEAIERARQRGDRGEVARLQKERERFQNRSQRQVQLAESRAGVARDDFEERRAKIEKEAEEQAIRDAEQTRNAKERVDAKQQELEAAQDQQEADREMYEARLRSIADEIDAAQKLADAVARDYEQRIRDQEQLIKEKEDADREQDKRDKELIANRQKHIANLKAAFAIVQQINQTAVDNAKDAVERSQEYSDRLKEGVTQIEEQNKRWLTQIGLLNEIIDKLKEANQTVSVAPQQNVTPPTPVVGPTPSGPADEPVAAPTPSAVPRPAPIRNHSGIPGLAPDGYHDEKVGNDWWWVPDGYKYDGSAPGRMVPDQGTPASPQGTPTAPTSPTAPAPASDPTESPTVGPQALRALDFSRTGLPDRTAAQIPPLDFGAAGDPREALRRRAPEWEFYDRINVEGPLMDHVTIRDDNDAKLVAKEIVGNLREAVDQAKRRGRIRPLGA